MPKRARGELVILRFPHEEATALGLHICASVGVVPRFATSHLATHNLARDGRQKSIRVEKMLFIRPADQASLRDCKRRRSFLDQFLDAVETSRDTEWFRTNATAFLWTGR